MISQLWNHLVLAPKRYVLAPKPKSVTRDRALKWDVFAKWLMLIPITSTLDLKLIMDDEPQKQQYRHLQKIYRILIEEIEKSVESIFF